MVEALDVLELAKLEVTGAIMGVLFGCFGRKIDGFRFLFDLVLSSSTRQKPIYLQPKRKDA